MSETLDDLAEQLRVQGLSQEQVLEELEIRLGRGAELLKPALIEQTEVVYKLELKRRRRFDRTLKRHWERAFHASELAIEATTALGARFNHVEVSGAVERNDLRFEVLTGLHAAACRTAREVLLLARSGYSGGAYARWRTLHEYAVFARVIGTADDGIAERFLAHRVIADYKDALNYQHCCSELGQPPIPAEGLSALEHRRAVVVARYGKDFEEDYGWAAPLQNGHITFLEELSGFGGLRPYYRTGSHQTHAGAKGLALNRIVDPTGTTLVSGPTEFGIGEPLHGGLLALHQLSVALIMHASTPVDLKYALELKAVQQLILEAGQSLHATSERRAAARRRVLAKLAKRDRKVQP